MPKIFEKIVESAKALEPIKLEKKLLLDCFIITLDNTLIYYD